MLFQFSFDNWLHSTLVPELGFPVPILHRRITWLVGQWTGVKITAESRPTIFGLLLNGLKSTDVVVRLSSSQALRSCLDDFDFMPEQFLPFLQEIFFLLFHLLKDVKESDNKVLNKLFIKFNPTRTREWTIRIIILFCFRCVC